MAAIITTAACNADSRQNESRGLYFYPALYLLPLRASCFRSSNISSGLLVVSPRYRSQPVVLNESLRSKRNVGCLIFLYIMLARLPAYKAPLYMTRITFLLRIPALGMSLFTLI